MNGELLLQYCLSGIRLGSIYAIVAIGFNIIYNTTGIINFAQGEFLVLGAMMAYTLHSIMPLLPAIVLAVMFAMIVGAFIEIIFLRWLKDPGVLRLIIITIGLSIVIREVISYVWGIEARALPFFTGTSGSSINIFGAGVSPQDIWLVSLCALMVIGLNLFYRFTITGRGMRATASNRKAAQICGINTKFLITLSFMISAGIGGLAGCALSPLIHTQYDMGASLAIKGFTVAILGGLGNNTAAVGAGIILGLIENVSVSILPNAYKDAVSIGILLLVLCIKPSGIFDKAEERALKGF